MSGEVSVNLRIGGGVFFFILILFIGAPDFCLHNNLLFIGSRLDQPIKQSESKTTNQAETVKIKSQEVDSNKDTQSPNEIKSSDIINWISSLDKKINNLGKKYEEKESILRGIEYLRKENRGFTSTLEKLFIIFIIIFFLYSIGFVFLVWNIIGKNRKIAELKPRVSEYHIAEPRSRDSYVNGTGLPDEQFNSFYKRLTEEIKTIRVILQETQLNAAKREPQNTGVDAATSDKILQLYNQAIHNPGARLEFVNKYNPISIGLSNYNERFETPKAPPLFSDNLNGDFIGISSPEIGPNKYFIFPQFDLALQDSIVTTAAMGIVFQCPNFDRRSTYRHFHVRKPAIFFKEPFNKWTFLVEGEIALGPGE